MVVTNRDFIINKSDLPKNKTRRKLDWAEKQFFEEIYSVEWMSAHVLDFLKRDWDISNTPLF